MMRRNQSAGGGGVNEKIKKQTTLKSEPASSVKVCERSKIRKTKSEIHRNTTTTTTGELSSNEKKSIMIRKTKSDIHRQSSKENSDENKAIQQITSSTIRSDDSNNWNELDVSKEKIMMESSKLSNVNQIESEKLVVDDYDDEDDYEEVEQIKEVNIPNEEEHKKAVNVQIIHKSESPPLLTSNVIKKEKTPPQVSDYPVNDQEFIKPPPISEEFKKLHETQSKFQNIVDLVMWKDISKTAFVFGFGSFILLSSSFTKDINFSLISAISYLGLFYLAATFFFKSILCRANSDMGELNQQYLVGEEEAIWLLHLILPYLNGFLLKFKSLFSGDPATTLKLAVILFVLARCGSSITIWNLAKLSFFAAFTVPKVCSSYSTQLTGYGNFWLRRFRDAWDSCSHKKAVAAAVFTIVWNLASITARVWAVFVLIVAVRHYQQSLLLLREEWEEEQEARGAEVPYVVHETRHKHDNVPHLTEMIKEKKGS
ncbi:Reticulon-like protein [Thalictrum thalictroides]|uniref:Reticulon-like protein n=1 Tax=Thalictrum thalictroides TaxID=46969 RepID=A0A7J6WE55_THATH|nr:Reticulon-like protein [Thalictrum thalictroides]